MAGRGNGYNPLFGYDPGARPPFGPPTPPGGRHNGQFAAGVWPGAHHGQGLYGQVVNGATTFYTQPVPGFTYHQTMMPGVFFSQQAHQGPPLPGMIPTASPFGAAHHLPHVIPGTAFIPAMTVAQPAAPRIDPNFPSVNLGNSRGGIGLETGYNYFFPERHTKVHVITSKTPPWNLPHNASVPFHPAQVPCNTTIGDLLKGFGANNPVPKKNRVYEVMEAGNGKWYKGQSFGGDDEESMKKHIEEVGWDHLRGTGNRPVVWLYVTKN